MREELARRRRFMLDLFFAGDPKWAEKTARKFDAKKTTIYTDKLRMSDWIEDLSGGILSPALDVLKSNLYELKRVRNEAWRAYHRSDSDNAKVGYLRVISKNARDHIKLLQNVGELQKQLGDDGEVDKSELINVNITSPDEDSEAKGIEE